MGGDQDELQFNIGEDEEETTVSMNQDGGDASIVKKEELIVEQEKAPSAKRTEDGPDSEDLDQYSQKVQKRIDKLTARLREHQRREEAAIEYARNIQKTNEELQERYKLSNVARMGEVRGRLDTQIMALKSVIKRAREENDIDTETEAQQRLTTTLWEQQRLAEGERQAKEEPVVKPQPVSSQPAQRAAPPPDPKAEEWAEKNTWFGKDIVMTNTVRGIHVELVKNEGFDPSSDEYYDEIDRRMRSLFPQHYPNTRKGREEAAPDDDNRGNRIASTVAPATRSSGVNSTARRMIKLRPSEVAIAKKLGVPLEEYAKYVKR